MSTGFSQWSTQRKLATFFDDQLLTDTAPLINSTEGVPMNTITSKESGMSALGLTSALVGACAVVGCGVASTYAYASYSKWKNKERKYLPDEEKDNTEQNAIGTSLFSNLRTAYNNFTSRERVSNKNTNTTSSLEVIHEGHREILTKHSKLLTAIKNNLTKAQIEYGEDETSLLNTTVEQLSEKFLISVVGEFNAGKSAFINSLLGGRFVQEGILPTTDFITKITYDQHESCTRNSAQNLMEVKLPVPWLKEVTIVDTPGTNALFELGHQAITEKFLPHSDLVLFVTSAERPLTESERQIIKRIREWDRKVVVVVNKCDLRTEEEKQQVIEYIRSNLEEILPGNDIPIFGVSARLALMSKIQACYQEDNERAPWQELYMSSNIGSVERYMFHSLDDMQKMRVKLQGPLSVANRFLAMYDAKLKEGETRLQQEQALLSSVDSLIDTHYKDLIRDFKNIHLSQVDRSFTKLLEGTEDFVDHHISFSSFMHFLMHPKAMQGTFREEVCQTFQTDVEGTAIKLSDWLTEVRSRMVEKVLQELNSVSNRSTTVMNVWKNIRVSPVVIGQDHQLELRQFREAVQAIIEKFTADEKHSRALVDSVQTSMTQILAVESCAGLVGLMWYSSFWMWLQQKNGTSTAERFFTMFTGPETSIARELAKPLPLIFLGAGAVMLGLSGLNILHYRRNIVKKKLAREANLCQDRLVTKLDTFVQEKAQKTVSDTMLWLQPFLQAIKTENDRIEEMKGLVGQWHEEVDAIATQIDEVTENSTQPVLEDGDAYPISKPMAYPAAVPLGPAPRGLQAQRKSYTSAPPSYANESPQYLSSNSFYPSLERVGSTTGMRSPTNYYSTNAPPKHFTYQTQQQQFAPLHQQFTSQQQQQFASPHQQHQQFSMNSPTLYRQSTPLSAPATPSRRSQIQVSPQPSPPVTAPSSPLQSDDEIEVEKPAGARKVTPILS